MEPFEIVKQLRNGCSECGKLLLFTNIVEETRCGLGSILYIVCKCGQHNTVYSAKIHYDQAKLHKTRPIFDINSKAAIGKYNKYISFKSF